MTTSLRLRFAAASICAALAGPAGAGGCSWSHIDHRVAYDASGPWNPNTYRTVVDGLSIAQVAGAVWEGSESRFGRTMWQGIDAEILSIATAEAGKYVFTRVRPRDQDDPCLWFEGGSNHSFPSEEAAVAAALVTPYVLEYASENPVTYAALLLPLYVGVARVKNQAHWQTDVIAGWTIGGLAGWYAHSRDVPILIELLPHGVAVGVRRQF